MILVVCIKETVQACLVSLSLLQFLSTVFFAFLQLLGSLQNAEDGGRGNATSYSCNCLKEEKYHTFGTHFNSCLCAPYFAKQHCAVTSPEILVKR